MKFSILFCLFLLPSCASRSVRTTPSVEVQPAPPMAVESLRRPEVVREYHVGRYVDPNHSAVMHEHHPIYRLEVGAQWNLRPTSGCVDAVSENAPYTDAAYSPPPSHDLITAELKRQKNATETVMWEATRLARSYDELQKVIKDMATVARNHSSMTAAFGQIDQRVARIENEFEQLLAPSPSTVTNSQVLQIEESEVP